jgi:hypothetical protein
MGLLPATLALAAKGFARNDINHRGSRVLFPPKAD